VKGKHAFYKERGGGEGPCVFGKKGKNRPVLRERRESERRNARENRKRKWQEKERGFVAMQKKRFVVFCRKGKVGRWVQERR